MIRSRLMAAFGFLALLAALQLLVSWWLTRSAAEHSQRSLVATKMLAEYHEISANKQRLKVWYAQRMLAADEDIAERDRLSAAMRASVTQLRELVERSDPATMAFERAEIASVSDNVDSLILAIAQAEMPASAPEAAQHWRSVLSAFDELAGRDMRVVLREAVLRHERASVEGSQRLSRALTQIRAINLALMFVVVVGGCLVVLYFLSRFNAPFARLAEHAQSLASGDYASRSDLHGRDEFSRIGQLLDHMAERLEQAQQHNVQMRDKLDQLVAERTRALSQAHETLLEIESRRRQFFAELSHELRTPVTVIRGEAELALRHAHGDEQTSEGLRRIVEVAGEIGARVQDLLDAARGRSLDYALSLQPVLLLEVIQNAVEQMQAVAAHRGVSLLVDAASGTADLLVEADQGRLQQVLVIVLDNALRYTAAPGQVGVRLSTEDDWALVSVDDQGAGMTDQELARAFEPHFRGKAARALDSSGAGIGLAIAKRLIEAHRGTIEVARREGGGLTVTLGVPVYADGTAEDG